MRRPLYSVIFRKRYYKYVSCCDHYALCLLVPGLCPLLVHACLTARHHCASVSCSSTMDYVTIALVLSKKMCFLAHTNAVSIETVCAWRDRSIFLIVLAPRVSVADVTPLHLRPAELRHDFGNEFAQASR